MKPDLVIGLGNPLMGDDGIGSRIAEGLRRDPRLPAHAEVIAGGTDLLRLANRLDNRRRVILIDALLGDGRPGSIVVVRESFQGFDAAQGGVHSFAATQAIELLRAVNPDLRFVQFTVIAVAIDCASLGCALSAPLEAALPCILDRVFAELLEGGEADVPGSARKDSEH